MVFNDTTNNSGLCQEVDALCDSDTTSYPLKDKTRRINAALEQVVGWILTADGTWQWDDSNYTDLPIGTINLIASQSGYTFNDKFLEIEKVEIKDFNGDWQPLKNIDELEEREESLDQMFETDGLPEYYDKISDDTIKLYPAPTAATTTLTNGLRVHFRRTAHLFEADGSDTTAMPGFASPYHVILAYMASIPFCMTYKKDRVSLYEKRVMDLKNELIQLYSQREKDVRKQMTFRRRAFK